MEQEQSFTEYDALVHSKDVQMLKSLLPFVDTQQQMSLAIFIQFIEFKNTIHIFKNNKNCLSASSITNEKDRQTAMMQALLKHIAPGEQETIDNMMNMINMMSMMENYESMMENYESMMENHENFT